MAKKNDMESLVAASTVADEEHPRYVAGVAEEDTVDRFTPNPNGPFPSPGPVPFPEPIPEPWDPTPAPSPSPPIRHPFPIRWCGAVSGKYKLSRPVLKPRYPILPNKRPNLAPIAPSWPIIPLNLVSVTVRVDVDRFFPQQRISIEVRRLVPNTRGHVIAEVTKDACVGLNYRIVDADITYREGDEAVIPGDSVRFVAKRSTGFGYGSYSLQLLSGGKVTRTYALSFESTSFDSVDFEVDRTHNSGEIVTSYDSDAHPNAPSSIPAETLSIAKVFERAGFDVTMSPAASVIPASGPGANGTWSDSEMHNAMVSYWSRFANRPQWAMWVLYAHRHDRGRGLGGIMFDDIGQNHRQGTAVFTDSFIQDVPVGDPDPAAWRRRMQFWTAVHEMGHGFNLAHSWQKSLSLGTNDPWIPLANEPEARSFMNYPFFVSGGEDAFFSNFEFRFSDDELAFMRHAPRRFVQMGNSAWFDNHGFEEPDEAMQTGRWKLAIRPNREGSFYRFLEPVTMELKLTNTGSAPAHVDADMLSEGGDVRVFIAREGRETESWRPLVRRLHAPHPHLLDVGESIYGAHVVSITTNGWLIDEPGFYKLQAAIDMGDEIVLSNVMRVYVGAPASGEEAAIAPEWFTEDVGRAVVFRGVPDLAHTEDVLSDVVDRCNDNPAAVHAVLALHDPSLRPFKTLECDGGRDSIRIKSTRSKISTASSNQLDVLLGDRRDEAADTLGHIPYFEQLRKVSEAWGGEDQSEQETDVLSASIDMMKHRQVLDRVVNAAEARLARRIDDPA